MNVDGKPFRSIWLGDDGWSANIIDQTRLPHEEIYLDIATIDEMAEAIRRNADRAMAVQPAAV